MPNKLQELSKKVSIGSIFKHKGTGADIAKVMTPVGKNDVTPWNREAANKGTEEFDKNFAIPVKAVYSDVEVTGAKNLATLAKEAAKNKGEIVKAQSDIDKAKTDWFAAEQKRIQDEANQSLARFQDKITTHTLLDSQAPQYAGIVGKYAREHNGALDVMAQMANIESKMKL